jgi:heat-inducible transcriptional repressor
MLSRVTRLLALVSAPPLETTTVRRVEVLLLQPDAVMILVITSTGGVTKRIVKVRRPRRSRARDVGRGIPERPPRGTDARFGLAAQAPRRS